MIAILQPDRTIVFGRSRVRAAIGRNGITREKREGDGCTPVGLLPLRRVFYRADRGPRPAATAPVEALAPNDGWCDDPADAKYNRFVPLPYPGHHETLWRDDALYDLIAVLGWNDAPAQPGRGSAIFLHVSSPDWAPTDGCIAVEKPALAEFLRAGLTAVQIS